jgi:hypothetical protein
VGTKADTMSSDNNFEWAEDRIKQALLEGRTELILSDMGLSALPASLEKLTNLQFLDLSENKFTELPSLILNLPQLHTLAFDFNPITTLPDWLGKLTQLTGLYLKFTQISVLPESLGQLSELGTLDLSCLSFKHDQVPLALPKSLGNLTKLETLYLSMNNLIELPETLVNCINLKRLTISDNCLTRLPYWIGTLENLVEINANNNNIDYLPDSIGSLTKLKTLVLGGSDTGSYYFYDEHGGKNNLKSLPSTIGYLPNLTELALDNNPLNPELAAAYKQDLDAVKAYLRAISGAQITLKEAKLILVGEGEVGKSCLLSALRGDEWEEDRPTTHGIEIKTVQISDPDSQEEITLNGWDFGGQRIYRPTHQLFFSEPAVYLVVWKPREGPQQGFVKEWIQLVKRREPDAKILVVATHGGPQQRQPDINRQELWDLFGKDTVLDFFFVESKPNQNGERRGIAELKRAIARVALSLPEVGRSVPRSFQEAWLALRDTGDAYLPLGHVLAICREHKMDEELARLFVIISHRLGYLIHYEHDPILRDIVVLKPDWLTTAISFVLDDEATRAAHGLVRLSHLSQLWDDPTRAADSRYPADLHRVFLRLMERFDLSYRVASLSPNADLDPQSLIAQLVPDNRPENDLAREWTSSPNVGDIQQVQICCIVDAHNGQSANAEGLFYQLIVRLHKYSLGRVNYNDSIHWQRGLVLDDDYNGRALLEHVGNDVRITVRAPYPERFLAMITSEVKYLVESFWEGLRCDVMVPCVAPCGRNEPGMGLFEVDKLIDSKRKNRSEYPCPVCNEWQNIDHLLRNAPATQSDITALIFTEISEVKAELANVRGQITYLGEKTMGRFDRLDDRTRRTLSRVDKTYSDFIQLLTDEGKDGPRLFSFVPVNRTAFNPKQWISAKFRLTLWCEHSHLPLPALNGKNSKKGVYEIELTHEWFKKAGPFLKLLTGTLSLVLPVASSTIKLALDETAYKTIEEQLDFCESVIDATIGETKKIGEFIGTADTITPERGIGIRAEGATLRQLHALLKAKDPSFGGLVRVINKRQEIFWVHPQFEKEY